MAQCTLSIENAKFWPILSNFRYFVANLRIFGALLQASIMRWWGMRFCELCSLSTYNVFRVETSLRRLHDNSIVEFPNWHVPGANGLGNQTTISQQTHCGGIMCRILILLCVCTEHSVSRSASLCLSSRISKRASVLSFKHCKQCVFPYSRFPCCVLLALSWNTNGNPSTDKLSWEGLLYPTLPCPMG